MPVIPGLPVIMPAAHLWKKKWMLEDIFGYCPKVTACIFGFLNPANDYALVFKVLQSLPEHVSLIILGGERQGGGMRPALEGLIDKMGLGNRVRITGFVPEQDFAGKVSVCDFFICPFRFKSNSGSVLRLADWQKPIFASDIPLTRELKNQGAPLHLFKDKEGLTDLINSNLERRLESLTNKYTCDFPKAAIMYLDRMQSAD
jgi:glycosyltransferase involved in cell wall biosynthesis